MYDEIRKICERYENDWKDTVWAHAGGAGHELNRELCPWDGRSERIGIIGALNRAGYKIFKVAGYGGEGKGDDYWVVFRFDKDDNQLYIKISGYYVSYGGESIDPMSWKIVEPKTKTVTYWE